MPPLRRHQGRLVAFNPCSGGAILPPSLESTCKHVTTLGLVLTHTGPVMILQKDRRLIITVAGVLGVCVCVCVCVCVSVWVVTGPAESPCRNVTLRPLRQESAAMAPRTFTSALGQPQPRGVAECSLQSGETLPFHPHMTTFNLTPISHTSPTLHSHIVSPKPHSCPPHPLPSHCASPPINPPTRLSSPPTLHPHTSF